MKRTIKVEFLSRPSIETNQDYNMVIDIEADLGDSWMDPIICYLRNGSLPNDSGKITESNLKLTKIGYPHIRSYIKVHFRTHTWDVSILRKCKKSYLNFMRETMEAILVADH